jgi:hypothetical protein
MRIFGSTLGLAILLCFSNASVQSQQSDPIGFETTFKNNLAKAQDACKAIWSDHALGRPHQHIVSARPATM